MFIISEFDSAENLQELDEKAENAIQDYFLPYLKILDNNGFPTDSKETKARITLDIDGWGHKVIDFKIRFRPKASNSSILKMLYNPEYGRAELIADGIGIEYDCKNEEDILLVQGYFDEKIYTPSGDKLEYTDKFILSEVSKQYEESSTINSPIPKIFQKNINEEGQSRNEEDERIIRFDKKGFSGRWYRDFKANVNLPVTTDADKRDAQKKYTGFEIRGVLEDNRNNSWLNDGRIYEQSKRIQAMIRLQWYVTEAYVKKVINQFYIRYPEAKFSKENLLKKYLWDLKKIYFWKRSNIYYTYNERFKTLSSRTELYPASVIEWK